MLEKCKSLYHKIINQVSGNSENGGGNNIHLLFFNYLLVIESNWKWSQTKKADEIAVSEDGHIGKLVPRFKSSKSQKSCKISEIG